MLRTAFEDHMVQQDAFVAKRWRSKSKDLILTFTFALRRLRAYLINCQYGDRGNSGDTLLLGADYAGNNLASSIVRNHN